MAGKADTHPRLHARRPKRSSKSGLPPGSLVHVGERKLEATTIGLIAFGPDSYAEQRLEHLSPDTLAPLLAGGGNPRHWLNVHGLHDPEVVRAIGRQFNLHPLVLEDILNTEQRPKAEDYGDYLFVVVRLHTLASDQMGITTEQVSLVIGDGYLLSFQERPTGSFDPVRDWLRQDKGRIRQRGADYLAYTLLDIIVDRYFSVLEQIAERSEHLEEALLERASPQHLHALHQLKREALGLRRAIWPLREVVNTLIRDNNRFFVEETRLYLRDIYDHTVHLIESLEAVRDLVSGLLDIYLSSISNKVNQEVRTLTVIALIFMPTTLITGIFGMNFRAMPLLDAPNGFLWAVGLMLSVVSGLGLLFWRRRWLR